MKSSSTVFFCTACLLTAALAGHARSKEPGNAAEPNIWDAVCNGDLAQVKKLVNDDPKAVGAVRTFPQPHKPSRTDGFTPLHFACFLDGHFRIARFLLKNGADPNATEGSGWTPLHEAQQARLAKLLLKHGARVDAKYAGAGIHPDRRPLSWQPVHAAARRGRLEMLRVLIAHGADPKNRDGEGKNALNHALEAGEKKVVEYLRDKLHLVPSTEIRENPPEPVPCLPAVPADEGT